MTGLHQVHKENVFEKELVEYLGIHGWEEGSDTKYDKELAERESGITVLEAMPQKKEGSVLVELLGDSF